jgi:competence protein ComEC
MILVWFCIAWLVGIVLGDWLKLPVLPTALLAGTLVVLGALWWQRRDVRMPLLLATALLLGGVRIGVAQPQTTARSVWAYAGHEVMLEAYVAQQPDRREDKQRAVVAAEQLSLNGQSRDVEGEVLLNLPPVPELRYGERVRVEGLLELPPSNGDFDYRAYLARHGIHAMMNKPKLIPLDGNRGAWWQRVALQLNDHARHTSLHLISEPHASLLVGILLGVQS